MTAQSLAPVPDSSGEDPLRVPTGSAIVTRHQLPEPPSNFYTKLVQEVIPTCGYEYQNADYRSAIEILNDRLALHLDQVELKVLGLLLTGLSQANRFPEMLHIDPIRGENSAAHSLNTAILANEMFRRAGLLSAQNQTAEVVGMRVEITLCELVHDMGEMLGELNSLDQRSRDSTLQENPKFERRVFDACLKLAYKAVLDDRPSDFEDAVREMRETAGIARGNGVNGGSEAFESVLAKYSEVALPPSAAASAAKFLRCFDLAELHDAEGAKDCDLFRGYVAKVIEHMQGNRHLIRHAAMTEGEARLRLFYSGLSVEHSARPPQDLPKTPGAEELLPLSYRESFSIRRALSYTEIELGDVFNHARSEAELALARAVRDSLYMTLIEGMYAGAPVFDRGAAATRADVGKLIRGLWKSDVSVDERTSRLAEIKEILGAVRSEQLEEVRKDRRESAGPLGHESLALRRFETRGRLMDLYLHAIETDYQPKPNEILAFHDELPEQLRNFPRRDWRREALKDGVPGPASIRGRTGA